MTRLVVGVLLTCSVAAVPSSGTHDSDDGTPEAAYRTYFAARMNLIEATEPGSHLYATLFADEAESDTCRARTAWRTDIEGHLTDVVRFWSGGQFAVLRATTAASPNTHGLRDIQAPLSRLVVLVRDEAAGWRVAADALVSDAEAQLLDAPRIGAEQALPVEAESVVTKAADDWLLEGMTEAIRAETPARTRTFTHVVAPTSDEVLVLVSFVARTQVPTFDLDGHRTDVVSRAYFVRDRLLLMHLERAADGWRCAHIRRVK